MASAATPAATASMTAKSALPISCSRCSSTGMMVSGNARLPKRRAQIAHFEVRMRMRIVPAGNCNCPLGISTAWCFVQSLAEESC